MLSRRKFLGTVAAGTVLRPARGASTQSVALRTHEWFGDILEEFPFPAEWHVTVHNMKGHETPPLAPAALAQTIQNPLGTKSLREIAAARRQSPSALTI